jgi:hypothetical protein
MFTKMVSNQRVLKEGITINLSKDIDDILTEYKLDKIKDDEYQTTSITKKPLLVKISRVDSVVVKIELVVEGTTERVIFYIEKDIWYMDSQSTLFSGNPNISLGDAKRMILYLMEGIRILWRRN